MKQRLIFMWSLKRSGSHAMETWTRGLRPDLCYLNNMSLKRPVDNKRKNQVPLDHEVFMISFEDQPICAGPVAQDVDAIIARAGLTGQYKRLINLIAIRDPFNLFASRIKGRWSLDHAREYIPVWKTYAKECLGITNHLPNVLMWNYNKWFTDIEYRKKLASDLDLEFNDDGKEILGHWGSSFDKKKYKKNAGEMKVLERWKVYENDPEYRALFDEEVVELSKELFDFVPMQLP